MKSKPTNTALIMTMGKGGVGKTTIAAAIAVELARRITACISAVPTLPRISATPSPPNRLAGHLDALI